MRQILRRAWRRRKIVLPIVIVVLLLAGIVGIAIQRTSAAWTDPAYMKATASAGM